MDPEDRQQLALERVEDALELAESGELEYPNLRDWSNVQYEEPYGLVPCQTPKLSTVSGLQLAKVVRILDVIRTLVTTGTRTTKRDIYYQMFVECSSQSEVDRLVSVIVAMLQVPRIVLGIVATSKGLVVGDLIYTNSEGVIVDCRLAVGGDSIPQDIVETTDMQTSAMFVLVVEKDAVFQRLLEEELLTSGVLPSMIMITGKGVPDLATRQLVRMLSVTYFNLPVLVLTDCDPYGLDIFLMYKFGSLAMTWAAEALNVSTAVWLGMTPSDILSLEIARDSTRPHSQHDVKRMMDLSKREYLQAGAGNERLAEELEKMWTLGRKAEIQQIVESRNVGFLAQEYLPWKIEQSLWI